MIGDVHIDQQYTAPIEMCTRFAGGTDHQRLKSARRSIERSRERCGGHVPSKRLTAAGGASDDDALLSVRFSGSGEDDCVPKPRQIPGDGWV